MKMALLEIMKALMKGVYRILCLFPVNSNKILFLSRQTNGPSLDFIEIQKELKKQDSQVKIVSICQRAEGGILSRIRFFWGMMRSLYQIATAKVCVLDTYWPPVSILPKRKGTYVIQIWHALGKLKQSGYQALDKEGGRDGKLAKALCMHRNYDIIIAGGKAWNPFYCQAFDVGEEILRNVGLPRIDVLLREHQQMNQEVRKAYPQFCVKPLVLYVPTFRRHDPAGWNQLVKAFDFQHYSLVVKAHPNQPLVCDQEQVLTCPEFPTNYLLAACDYCITDYSSISLEAAILNKKTYYYVYDYEDYMANNGMNIDICKEMPHCVFQDAESLVEAIHSSHYPEEELASFKQKYLPENLGSSTTEIVRIIREKQRGIL